MLMILGHRILMQIAWFLCTSFADYMQCHNLRQVILDYWRNQLDNGLAYANIVFYGLEVQGAIYR